MLKENTYRPVIIWLLTGCAFIFLMVVIGGITRLTESGLSMVDWRLIMGMIPPLNEQEWVDTFEKYKQFPEYKAVNFMFTLEEFKAIFFWEYLHRLIGRLLGLVFLIPFIYFLITKKITGKLVKQCVVILIMGAFQGFLGWWMVKSGLVDNPDVSHYRLAVHLLAAFLTFAYTLWVALGLICRSERTPRFPFMQRWIKVLLVLVLIQIVYGAFVAGLNAGKVMNTWPKMGEEWVSKSVVALQPFWVNFIDGIGGVQFVHRYLAYVVVGMVLFILLKSTQYKLNKSQTAGIKALLIVVFGQFLLGIFTLIYAVPIWLGVLHQVGALILLGTVVYSINSFKARN